MMQGAMSLISLSEMKPRMGQGAADSLGGHGNQEGVSPSTTQLFAHSNEQKEDYYESLRSLLLAKSYECMDNKVEATHHYKRALSFNPENYEAFNRVISNYLLTKDEKLELINNNMTFKPENLWLKDFYLSKIDQQLIRSEDQEGSMIIRSQIQNASLHNNVGDMDGEVSGMSPSRCFPPTEQYLEDYEDPNDTLRNPNGATRSNAFSPSGLNQQ